MSRLVPLALKPKLHPGKVCLMQDSNNYDAGAHDDIGRINTIQSN